MDETIWDTTNEFIEESRSYKQSDSNDLDQGHSSETPRLRRLTSPVSHHPTFGSLQVRAL